MKHHKAISISSADTFDDAGYPSLKEELGNIAGQTENMLSLHKVDIIVSYLKDHSIQTTWIAANPLVSALVTSNVLPTATIEALFEASRNHPLFRKQLEAFIRESLAAKSQTTTG